MRLLSEGEYLLFERAAEERHQYLDGKLIPVPSESGDHADICTNLVYRLGTQLRNAPFRVRTILTKARSGPGRKSRKRPKALYAYPDIVVIGDKLEYLDKHTDVVLNPAVIVEVLSESTEALDRGIKFVHYARYNPTLTDYVLVSQAHPQIEHYHREADGIWTYRCHEGLKAIVKLASIGCRLKASEVYRLVNFKKVDNE